MKFLINNYSSNNQTEPMYLNAGINLITGMSSFLWNGQQISAYDAFDLMKPDYFITHIDNLPMDCLSYMKNNKNIELILNITGTQETNINNVVNILEEHDIKSAFFFTNSDNIDIKLKNINIITIGLGADVFFAAGNNNKLNYRINKGVFINNKSQVKNLDGTYHHLSHENNMQGYADIVLPIYGISNIYKNYDNIIFKFFGTIIPQTFYDSVFYGNKVYYEIEDSVLANNINEKFKKIFKINYDICNNENVDFGSLKDKIKSKHTCLHRLKSLLSQLPLQDSVKNIDNLIKKYTNEGN
jgi:hypothetical protein